MSSRMNVMRYAINLMCFVVTVTLVGCTSFKNLTAPKLTESKTKVGGADASYAKKVKHPDKIHLAYGAWHEQKGDYLEAEKSYKKVLEKKPKDLEANLGLARIEEAFNHYEKCDDHLQKALKDHPKDPRVLVAIAQKHAHRDEWDAALETMKAAQEMAPFDPMYAYHLAVIEARTGDVTSAFDHFSRSIGIAEAHYNIGKILDEKGETEEAVSHFKKALKLKPELKQAEAALAEMRTNNPDEFVPASYQTNKKR